MTAHFKKHSVNNVEDHIGVLGAVTGNLVEFNSDGLFADSGAKISDFALVSHTHVAADITDFDVEVSNNVDVTANTGARHTHPNKALLDTYTQTEADLADAVLKKHAHANKALLDSYTQTESNLADAVLKKHTQNTDIKLDEGNVNEVSASELRSHLDNDNAHDGTAIDLDTTNFDGILSSADNTVQKALETLDDFSPAAVTWGSITGTLANQVDLQSALDLKANVNHTHVATDITDFDAEVSNNVDVTANSAARHTQNSDLYLDFGNANQVSALEIRAFIDSKAVANGLASLDASGKVPTSQLPNLSITSVDVVADITARDALVVEAGDVAKVLDGGAGYVETFIYDGSVWVKIDESADVISVNAKTGVVVLDTDDINEGSTNLYYTDARVSLNSDVTNNTLNSHVQNTDTQLRSGLVDTSSLGELKIKVFRQATQPVLSADEMMALWVDSDAGNQTFLMFRESSSNTVLVELA